jgi:hypothetical protein
MLRHAASLSAEVVEVKSEGRRTCLTYATVRTYSFSAYVEATSIKRLVWDYSLLY